MDQKNDYSPEKEKPNKEALIKEDLLINEQEKTAGAIFDNILAQYKNEMEEELKELLAIRTVRSPGNEGAPFGAEINKGLLASLALAKNLGYTCENLDGYMGIADYGNAPEQVGILAHIDVVPEGNGWTVPPYAGVIVNGRIYGRGAIDNKGPLIASLYAGMAVQKSKLPLSRTIRCLIGTDEESGFECLSYFLKHRQPPQVGFSPDGHFPVIYAEKGRVCFKFCYSFAREKGDILLSSLAGGSAANMVPDTAQAILATSAEGSAAIYAAYEIYSQKDNLLLEEDGLSFTITAKGVCAHASLPKTGVNAISILLGFLSRLKFAPLGVCHFVRHIYPIVCDDANNAALGKEFTDESGLLTIVPSVLKMELGKTSSTKKKVEEGVVSLLVDMRYPIFADSEKIHEHFNSSATAVGINLCRWEDSPPLYVDKESPLVSTLLAAYREIVKDTFPPLAIGGGTYARAMKNFVAFGPVFPHGLELAHQADEYISTENLFRLARIYARAIYRLAKEEPEA